jgi:hypothetical protein
MLFRRRQDRRLAREWDEREDNAKAAARRLVARITACFVSDPDAYDVRAAVITKGETDDLLLVRLAWSDDDRAEYFSGNPWCVVEDVLDVPDTATGRQRAADWIGDSVREVPFNLLPGLFQEAYVAAVVQPAPPADPLGYWWVVPTDAEHWPVRIFPSGIGEDAPPIGEVGFVLMPRAAIEEMWRLRGW